jgi:SAM-dependent methyltransferase
MGLSLRDFLDHYDIHPKTVLDIGCHVGGMLEPFRQMGADVIGLEVDPRSIAVAQAHGLNVEDHTVEWLDEQGTKADLILMNHILEHFSDIPGTLEKVRRLLAPNGLLYIGVPGLKTAPLDRLWQVAHMYQFTYDTLEYVMNCCGFEALYCDEQITSLWKYTGKHMPWSMVTPNLANDYLEWITKERRRVPEIKTYNKFKLSERKKALQESFATKIPDLVSIQGCEMGQEAMIICGGPSLDGQLAAMRELQAKGAVIVCIERMYEWAMTHHFRPDYVVVLDASDDVLDGLHLLSHQTRHCVATQCGERVIRRLEGHQVYLFNSPQAGIDVQTLWAECGYQRCAVLNAGGSVSLAALSVSMFLGMTTIHMFGFDCHITAGNYATGIKGVGCVKGGFEVEVGDRVFLTTAPYLSFAQQFFKLIDMARANGCIRAMNVYGDSLVNAMAAEPLNWEDDDGEHNGDGQPHHS